MSLHRLLLVSASILALNTVAAYAQNNSITPTGDNTDITQTNTTISTNTTTTSTSTNSSTVNGTQINNNNTYIVPPDSNNNNNAHNNSSIRRRGPDNSGNWRRDASRPYERGRYNDHDNTSTNGVGYRLSTGTYSDNPSVTGSARTINNTMPGDGRVTRPSTGPATPVYIMTPNGGSVYNSSNPPPATVTIPASATGGSSGGRGGRHHH